MDLIPTVHGLVGYTAAPAGDGPASVVIRGVTALNQLHELRTGFLDLPGFVAPTFADYRVQTIAAAFDAALAQALPGRQARLVGVSAGAIVAMHMRSPQIAEVLAVEPFLDASARCWPLEEWAKRIDGELSRFCGEFFRLPGPGRLFTDRPVAPMAVLCGDVPLGAPRALPAWPSLCSESDEATLRSIARSFSRVAGGHDLPRENLQAIRDLLADADPADRE